MREQIDKVVYYTVVFAGCGAISYALTKFIVWLDKPKKRKVRT